jgi:hypothetical protein
MTVRRLLAALIIAAALLPVAAASVIYRSMADVPTATVLGLEFAGSATNADARLCQAFSDPKTCTDRQEAADAVRADTLVIVPGYTLTLLFGCLIARRRGRRPAATLCATATVFAAACDLVENSFTIQALAGDSAAWAFATALAVTKFLLLVPPLLLCVRTFAKLLADPPDFISTPTGHRARV